MERGPEFADGVGIIGLGEARYRNLGTYSLGMKQRAKLAQAIVHGHQQAQDETAVRMGYERSLRAVQPRFELYRKASRVNAHPWLADLVIWRARNSARILRRMSGVLEETANPGNLVSVRGLTRLFLPIR